MSSKIIGVLALQGDFSKHIEVLHRLGIQTQEVRTPEELERCDSLILPGGESTVIWRQMKFIGLLEKIKIFSEKKPVFGTCAGLILMSKKILGDGPEPFGLLDIEVVRNAFGRQSESFETEIAINLKPNKSSAPFKAVFIRAPRIEKCGKDVQVLARYNNEPILVRQGLFLGATFHPELTLNPIIHQYFLSF